MLSRLKAALADRRGGRRFACATRKVMGNLADIGGPLVAVAIALWITLPAWGPTPFAGVDVTAYLRRVTFGVEHLVTHGRLDGWNPGSFLGYQHFLIRGPGLTWLVALVRAASLGQLSTIVALNVVVLGFFALSPLSVAFMARSFGLGRSASGIAAILALLVSNPYGTGIQGLFDLGLMENQVAAVFYYLALGGLVRVASDDGWRWVLFTTAALAALVVTHLPSTVVLFPLIAFYLPWFLVASRRPQLALARLLLAGTLAAGLAGFWLVPLLKHRDLAGIVAGGFGPPSLGQNVRAILEGKLLFRPGIAWVVLAGWAFALVQALNGRRFALGLVLGPVAYLVLGHEFASRWPSELKEQIALRGLGYAGVLATFPFAMLLRATTRPLGVIGNALALAAASALVILPVGPLRGLARPYPEPGRPLPEAAAVLARAVPSSARFVSSQRIPYLGVLVFHPDWWLAWRSGRNSLTGMTLEVTSTPWALTVAERLEDSPPEDYADTIVRLGVTHVVTASDSVADRLAASTRFTPVWHSSPLAILAVRPRPGMPDPSSLLATAQSARARLEGSEPEHLRIEVLTETPTEASVAVAWSPKWHGTLNGSPCALGRTPDGLIAVKLPPGLSLLALDYRTDRWDRLGLAITLATGAGILGWCVRRRPVRS